VEYLSGRGKPVREETMLAALGLAADAPVLRFLCENGTLIKSQEIRQRILDEKLVMARLADGISELSDITEVKITAKQKAVVELLSRVGQASLKEVCYFAAVGKTVPDRLEKAGILHYFTREVYRSPFANRHAREDSDSIALSDEQGNGL
jgi:primosomal protein N' (replication factor Y)